MCFFVTGKEGKTGTVRVKNFPQGSLGTELSFEKI